MSAPQSLAEPVTEPHPAPPPVQMGQLLAGFQLSQALYAAAKLGVADQLRGGLNDAMSLAAAVGAEAQPLRGDRVLRPAVLQLAIRAAAPAGAQLLAFELVAPDGGEPHMAKMIDLTMLGMLNGRERTQAEYRQLLEQAGFAFDAVTATPTPISIVRARA